jgi:hypothetical protein
MNENKNILLHIKINFFIASLKLRLIQTTFEIFILIFQLMFLKKIFQSMSGKMFHYETINIFISLIIF